MYGLPMFGALDSVIFSTTTCPLEDVDSFRTPTTTIGHWDTVAGEQQP